MLDARLVQCPVYKFVRYHGISSRPALAAVILRWDRLSSRSRRQPGKAVPLRDTGAGMTTAAGLHVKIFAGRYTSRAVEEE